MYSVGNKVVHPCYGAGIIGRVQEKSIGDTSHMYYVIDTVAKAMQIMVPVNRADEMGLRHVGNEGVLRSQLDRCGELPTESEIESDLRARQGDMREQLKSGDFAQVAQVVRVLFFMNNRRPLGTVDRQLLDQGKEMLASELALACDIEIDLATQQVEDTLAEMLRVAEE